MKKRLGFLLAAVVPFLSSASVWAAEEVAKESTKLSASSTEYFVFTSLAIALGFSICTGLCGLGQGNAIRGGLEGIARQPEASDKIQMSMLLGLAFIESLALFALFVCIILLFANPFIKYLQ
jgi:F-type H+-transporting ATPase subunit c